MTQQALIKKARDGRLKALQSLNGPRSARPGYGNVIAFCSARARDNAGYMTNIFANLQDMPDAA